MASARELWRRFRSAPDDQIAATTIAVGALVAIGAAVGLGLQFVAGDWVSSFVADNALGSSRRQVLLRTLVLGMTGGAVVALATALWPPQTAGPRRLTTAARLAAPLALMIAVPPLLRFDGSSDALTLAALIGVRGRSGPAALASALRSVSGLARLAGPAAAPRAKLD